MADVPDDADDSVRGGYARLGVAGYYAAHGEHYRNPHEAGVRAAVAAFVERLPAGTVLDLAAGSGEVTLALRELGRDAADIVGCDPHTGAAYRERTGVVPESWSFEQLSQGLERRFAAVVCSFALHLCPSSWLPKLVIAMAGAAPVLLVITPHKRPELRDAWGFVLDEERYFVEHRVRARLYRSRHV